MTPKYQMGSPMGLQAFSFTPSTTENSIPRGHTMKETAFSDAVICY